MFGFLGCSLVRLECVFLPKPNDGSTFGLLMLSRFRRFVLLTGGARSNESPLVSLRRFFLFFPVLLCPAFDLRVLEFSLSSLLFLERNNSFFFSSSKLELSVGDGVGANEDNEDGTLQPPPSGCDDGTLAATELRNPAMAAIQHHQRQKICIHHHIIVLLWLYCSLF